VEDVGKEEIQSIKREINWVHKETQIQWTLTEEEKGIGYYDLKE